jgi:hypothetical protein
MRPLSNLLLTSAAVALAGMLAAPVSTAAAAGSARPHWARVTATGLSNSDDIGLARGRDGVLHVLWTLGSPGKVRVLDTQIAATGRIGKTVVLASRLWAATGPDAVATSAGLDAFWNGQRTSSSIKKGTGTWRATRPLRGGTWHLASITPAVDNLWNSSVGGAPGTGGQPWVAFGFSGGFGVLHYGRPERGLPAPACCFFNEGIGTDARTGTAWLTYFSSTSGHVGTFDQELTSAGARLGRAHRMPGSAVGGHSIPAAERVTATGRPGRTGVYACYLTGFPNAHAVDVYRFGSAKAITVARVSRGSGTLGSTLAADQNGRLWVAWWGGKIGAPALFVSRSNTAASRFGRAVRVPLPAGASALYRAYVSAQPKRLDVLALLIVNGKIAYWATQVPAPR